MLTLRNLYFISFVFLIFNSTTFGQNVNFDKIVPPQGYRAKTFVDYLVQLAWLNNPNNNSLGEEVEIAKEEYEITRWEWARDFRATGSYNETNFLTDSKIRPKVSDAQELQLQRFLQTLVVPRFTLTATLNLGTLITLPKEKRVAKHKIKIAEHKLNQEKHQIRADVLERYQKYLLANQILKTRTLAEEDAVTMYTLLEKMFKKGDAEFKDWNAASTTYWAANEATTVAKSDVKIAIIALEEIIGIKWENALKMKVRYKN